MRGTELPTCAIPDRLTEGMLQPTGMRTNPLRAIGVGQNSFANEVFIDELAAQPRRRSRSVPAAAAGQDTARSAPSPCDRGSRRGWPTGKASGRGLGIAYLDYSGTQVAGVAEVSVDRPTGAIKVHEFWCAIDCGVPVHPDNVIAQTESSIVYGLVSRSASASRSRTVRCSSRTSTTYLTRMKDVPEIHVKLSRPATIRRAPARWRRRWCHPRSRTRCSS